MATIIEKTVSETELQHKHPFHFKELYKMMHDYLEENGYVADVGGDAYEKFYAEKVHGNGMKEVRYWWHTYKHAVPGRITFHLTIRIRALAIKDKETVFNGKKVKVQDGEITIQLKQDIKVDLSFLDKHWLGKLLSDLIKKRWYKAYFEQYKKQAYDEFYDFENTIKRWLNWYQHALVKRPFRSSLGVYRAKSEFEK